MSYRAEKAAPWSFCGAQPLDVRKEILATCRLRLLSEWHMSRARARADQWLRLHESRNVWGTAKQITVTPVIQNRSDPSGLTGLLFPGKAFASARPGSP